MPPVTPRPRPAPSGYSRRPSSTRRDIRMDNRRRRSPNRGPILIVIAAAVLLIAVIAMILALSRGGQSAAPTAPKPSQTAPQGTTDPTKGGMAYTDDRVPHYTGKNPVWETMTFAWDRQDNLGSIQIQIPVDRQMYLHYRSLARYQGIDNYPNYINDANNKALIRQIVEAIRKATDGLSYSDSAMVRELAKFTQDVIEYQYDSDTTGEDEYPRYPIETLYEGRGDCEDTSILMAALLKELGYDVGFLHVPGHIAVALRTADDYSGGDYYEIGGRRYLFIESTGSGWNIGDIPEDYQNVSATFYPIP